jgi:hypothetical protein
MDSRGASAAPCAREEVGQGWTDDEQAADRNDYAEGFRKGLRLAIKVGTRTAQGLVDEYKSGAYDVVEAIEKVLKDAK